MKATKNYRVKFHCRMSVIALLGVAGLIAICGEPDESLTASQWLFTFGCQLAICAVCWISAWLLCRRWNISRKMRMIEYRQKQQMKAL